MNTEIKGEDELNMGSLVRVTGKSFEFFTVGRKGQWIKRNIWYQQSLVTATEGRHLFTIQMHALSSVVKKDQHILSKTQRPTEGRQYYQLISSPISLYHSMVRTTLLQVDIYR